jgi:pimeloyl-ACP methyl ester carboxylesterase
VAVDDVTASAPGQARRPSRATRPVMVLPGLGGSDRSTVAIRSQLSALGHPVHGWGMGRNEGPSEGLTVDLSARLTDLSERYEAPLALVGWSLGGAFALALAGRQPGQVALVVTMGSPLSRVPDAEGVSGIPLTSIWSRNDRVVPWTASRIAAGRLRENVEVRSLHLTLGFDPAVLGVVADRAAQPTDGWRPFRPPAWARRAFPDPDRGR